MEVTVILKLEFGIRTNGYEIIPELKYNKNPEPSEFSFKSGTLKKQPKILKTNNEFKNGK